MADPFVANEFKGGKTHSAIGDEACVETNTTTTLNFADEIDLSEVTAVGAGYLDVLKHIYFVPGLVLQITHPSDTDLSVMVEVAAVAAQSATESRLSLVPNEDNDAVLDGTFVGAGVSIAQNFLRPEAVYGNAAAPAVWDVAVTIPTVTVATAKWVENQWVGRYLWDEDSDAKFLIIANSATVLFVDDTGIPPPSPTTTSRVAIAHNFEPGTTWASRVPTWKMTSRSARMTTLLEPALDLERLGTPWYGHHHLLGGANVAPLTGAWLPKDVGLTITTPGLLSFMAKASNLSGDGLTLTLQLPTLLVVNAHVGSFLNPNQNQGQLFKIVSNTSTTITVDSSMSGAFSVGQVAYVLPPRNAIKYTRVLDRLRAYVNPDIRVHILFSEV